MYLYITCIECLSVLCLCVYVMYRIFFLCIEYFLFLLSLKYHRLNNTRKNVARSVHQRSLIKFFNHSKIVYKYVRRKKAKRRKKKNRASKALENIIFILLQHYWLERSRINPIVCDLCMCVCVCVCYD